MLRCSGNYNGLMGGFQLWANLPAKKKMIDPRYQEFSEKEISIINLDNGIIIKIICGVTQNIKGPVENVVISPEYLDVTIPPDTLFTHEIKDGYTLFAYVIEGKAYFDQKKDAYSFDVKSNSYLDFKDRDGLIGNGSLVLYTIIG